MGAAGRITYRGGHPFHNHIFANIEYFKLSFMVNKLYAHNTKYNGVLKSGFSTHQMTPQDPAVSRAHRLRNAGIYHKNIYQVNYMLTVQKYKRNITEMFLMNVLRSQN